MLTRCTHQEILVSCKEFRSPCECQQWCPFLLPIIAGFLARHKVPVSFTEGVANGPRHAAAVRLHDKGYLEDLLATSASVAKDQIKHPFVKGGLLSFPPDYGEQGQSAKLTVLARGLISIQDTRHQALPYYGRRK